VQDVISSPTRGLDIVANTLPTAPQFGVLPAEEQSGLTDAIHQVRGIVHRPAAQIAELRRAGALSEKGIAAEAEKVKADANKALDRIDAETAKLEDERGAGYERVASGRLQPDGAYGYIEKMPPAPTVEQLMLHREIRDRLSNLKSADVADLYLKAVREGNDAELIAAIEGAPKAFALVTPFTREMARKMRVEMSPFAHQFEHRDFVLEARKRLVAKAREVLAALK